ncbi:serine/threonine-protein kinase PAK 3-like isoform X1 [Corvus hawaiiensis]|nr:serine/threonine-protein kinase PAK 3-like isoform X1 [Corvus hawaiiensis]
MSSKQLGLSEATKMPAGTSTLAFSQSLGEEKSRLLGFLGALLDRCIFGVTPGCLEHWLMDGHLTRGWRHARPLGSPAGSAPPLAPSLAEEEAEEEPNDKKPPSVVHPQPERAEPLSLDARSAVQRAAAPARSAAASTPPHASTSSSSPAQQLEMREEQSLRRLRSIVSLGEPRRKYSAFEELGRG